MDKINIMFKNVKIKHRNVKVSLKIQPIDDTVQQLQIEDLQW